MMQGMNLAELRQNYSKGRLEERELPADPLTLFELWLEEAQAAEVLEPNAMILATASQDGFPSARAVLLKGLDARGFQFFTNYASRKGQEIAANPNVALVFNWLGLERQVRVEGEASKLSRSESDAYFKTRPRGSQLSALVSPQSRVVEDRAVLETHFAAYEAAYPDVVPLPENWGGYAVLPQTLEFWQGRSGRLHDRIRYTRQGEDWTRERLAP
jgi:pyridoxamine 5'-phosphate oxidase